jgi:hypothetical protein
MDDLSRRRELQRKDFCYSKDRTIKNIQIEEKQKKNEQLLRYQ